jgi:hypothetical protein
MSRLLLIVGVLGASLVQAAELTRVASSFEEKDPFGMYLDFTFDRLQDKGRLTREWYQGNQTVDVNELNYLHVQTSLGFDIHLGIFRDLELHVGVPIVFQDDRTWTFSKDTDLSNTTITRNCPNARGDLCQTPGMGTNSLFDIGPDGVSSYRAGLGDFTFGVAWAPYVQAKDSSKPTWVLKFDWTAPTSTMLNPSVQTTAMSRGAIGDRVHKYTFATAVSKRLYIIEPYFELHYTLPWNGSGWYSNCDTPTNTSMGHPENCGNNWSRAETGMKPQHTGGVNFGTELTMFERADRHQRVLFDLRGWLTYLSEGRVYNEMSDLFGKLLYTGDYGQLGGQVGFVAQAAEFVILRAYTSFAYNTERFLTSENVGKDLNGNQVVDVTAAPQELSPTYDFRTDRVGRRFRMQEQYLFRVQVTATFNF